MLGVDRDRELDPEPRQPRGDVLGLGGEGEARRLDADHAQPRLAVAALPLGQVGERADAVQLRVFDEVDERRAAGGQRRHRLRFGSDPGEAGGQVGGGDVVASGAHLGVLEAGQYPGRVTELVAFLLPALPLLALLLTLLLGHYPGCEAIVRLSERIAGRRRTRDAVRRPALPKPPAPPRPPAAS